MSRGDLRGVVIYGYQGSLRSECSIWFKGSKISCRVGSTRSSNESTRTASSIWINFSGELQHWGNKGEINNCTI